VIRWSVWGLGVLAVCVGILLSRSSHPGLLADTDTAVLLEAIRERSSPFSWFGGDWPLGNHFYRPVSTLLFELDAALFGDQAWGFGLTNALLAAACVAALFWFVKEWTELPWVAGLSAMLFGLWHFAAAGLWWVGQLAALFAGLPLLGLARWKSRPWGRVLVALVGAVFVASQIDPVVSLGGRIVGWLPGRTASSMTLFALVALAAYARFLRLTAPPGPLPAATALDVPLTKSAPQARRSSSPSWFWLGLSLAATAMALGCYEQAVMLPLLLTCVHGSFWHKGRRLSWAPVVGFFGLLLAYVALRLALVPAEASGYQLQQFRSGPGVFLSLSDYILPAGGWIYRFAIIASVGWEAVLVPELWWLLVLVVGNGVMVWVALKSSRANWLIGAWTMSCLAFLPMAWLKTFEHYHYWPAALRALLVVLLVAEALRLAAIAVSPPVLQAPPRPSPAPGSLRRL
jgi:hypothetical protein